MLFVLKINVIVLHNFKYMGYFCATKYIRTSFSTAVITRITWWENYFTLRSGFLWFFFKLLGDLSWASRKGSTLHKPNHWHPARLRSKHYYIDKNGRRFQKEKGEFETAAAGLAGLGLARKEDFQTLFILNKTLKYLCYNSQQSLL